MQWERSALGLRWDGGKGGGLSDDNITGGLEGNLVQKFFRGKTKVRTSRSCLPDIVASLGMDENRI